MSLFGLPEQTAEEAFACGCLVRTQEWLPSLVGAVDGDLKAGRFTHGVEDLFQQLENVRACARAHGFSLVRKHGITSVMGTSGTRSARKVEKTVKAYSREDAFSSPNLCVWTKYRDLYNSNPSRLVDRTTGLPYALLDYDAHWYPLSIPLCPSHAPLLDGYNRFLERHLYPRVYQLNCGDSCHRSGVRASISGNALSSYFSYVSECSPFFRLQVSELFRDESLRFVQVCSISVLVREYPHFSLRDLQKLADLHGIEYDYSRTSKPMIVNLIKHHTCTNTDVCVPDAVYLFKMYDRASRRRG